MLVKDIECIINYSLSRLGTIENINLNTKRIRPYHGIETGVIAGTHLLCCKPVSKFQLGIGMNIPVLD
jgi:hypothetical protein